MFHLFESKSIHILLVTRNLHQLRQMSRTLETLEFDNKALRRLPLDAIEDNYVRSVSNACFSRVTPTPLSNPRLVSYSKSALKLIDIAEEEVVSEDFVQYMTGNKVMSGSEPASHCYCGHQFGINGRTGCL